MVQAHAALSSRAKLNFELHIVYFLTTDECDLLAFVSSYSKKEPFIVEGKLLKSHHLQASTWLFLPPN